MDILLFIMFCFVQQIRGYSSGAPTSACVSMEPGHSGSSQTTNTPISFELKPDTFYNANEPVIGKSYNF